MTDPVESPPSTRRRLVRVLGIALAIASLAYIAYKIGDADWSALSGVATANILPALLASSLAYCGLGIILGLAWWLLLSGLVDVRIGARFVASLYAVTQIYKYLPTNMLHFVGRHVVLRNAGLPHSALVTTALAEAASVSIAAIAVAIILGGNTLLELGTQQAGGDVAYVWSLVAVVAVIGSAGVGFAFFRGWVSTNWLLFRRPAFLRAFLLANLMHIVFFVGTGFILLELARQITTVETSDFGLVIAAGSISWLLGFVVPGSAAGIGVREAMMIVILTGPIGDANAIALAGLYRITTVGGDVLLAVLGSFAQPASLQREVERD